MEKTITKINNQNISIIDNGNEKLVPIKPICQALGIAFQPQYDKIKNDEILSSTIMLSMTVGADEKKREMVCLPLQYVFGWLFTINPGNVADDAKENLVEYKKECYDALYKYFTLKSRILDYQNQNLVKLSDMMSDAQYRFATAKNELNKLRESFKQFKNKSYNDLELEVLSMMDFKDDEL